MTGRLTESNRHLRQESFPGGHFARGDNSGADNIYVWREGKTVHARPAPADILNVMKNSGKAVEINRDSIVFLLHNSLVPTPLSVFKDVYVLGVGDHVTFQDNPAAAPVFGCDYPYYQEKSTGASVPSTKKLLDLLCKSLQKKTDGNAVLMLSSGKDSVAIALAIKECGLAGKIPAYTYADAASGYGAEAADAAKIAQKLGLKHKTIEVPDSAPKVKEALENFFAQASYPSCDPTTIPYVVGLYHEGIRGAGIIDGTRSDMSMGIFPSSPYHWLCRYYRAIGGGWQKFEKLKSCVPFHRKIAKFFSSYPEVNLYRHGHFRAEETRRFFDHNIDTKRFWLDVYKSQKNKSLVDGYTYINDQFFAGCGILPKIKTVAESLGCMPVMPWADWDIADYYFNLPVEHKYDLRTKTNKILLRRMLKEKLDYDAAAYGKRIFYFNMEKFVRENEKFVRGEILGCSLWNKKMEREFDKYFGMLEAHPRVGGALVDLFMISGWCNHSKHLKGS